MPASFINILELLCEFNGGCVDFKGPLVCIIDTASTGGIEFPALRITPCPQVVTSLNQITDHNIIPLGELIGSISACTQRSLLEIHGYCDRHLGCIHDPDDRWLALHVHAEWSGVTGIVAGSRSRRAPCG